MLFHRDYRDEILDLLDDERAHHLEEFRKIGNGALVELSRMIRRLEVVETEAGVYLISQ